MSSAAKLRRRGITLIEVLISVGVATIGLLGVISLIPLAASQTQRGEMAARGATIGNSAISELHIYGGFDPRIWVRVNGSPMGLTMIPVLQNNPATPVCIDPRGVAEFIASSPSSLPPYMTFPFPPGTGAAMERISLSDRDPALLVNPLNLNRRPLNSLAADFYFQSRDDLVVQEPSDGDLLPYQTWYPSDDFETLKNNNFAAPPPALLTRRQFEGTMSWMATLWPRWEGEDAAFTPGGPIRYRDEYLCSIVVFKGRILGQEITTPVLFDFNGDGTNDADGVTGGTIVLNFAANPADAETPLPEDSWLLLSGMIQVTPTRQLPVFRWYRVLSSDPDPINPLLRHVMLDGPDWNMSAQNVRATIIPGTVAVFEKVIRLETSSLWSN